MVGELIKISMGHDMASAGNETRAAQPKIGARNMKHPCTAIKNVSRSVSGVNQKTEMKKSFRSGEHKKRSLGTETKQA